MSATENQADPRETPLHKGTIEKFAQNMANAIIQSLQLEIQNYEDFKERHAKTLAMNVIETALREVSQKNSTSHQQETSKSDQTSQQIYPTLPQSGLPNLGSLDYPDAPPPTPLLPEMVKNRQSFTRKLKGGLAKEFTPSPPPPTPKDEQDRSEFDQSKVEMMQQLMDSLTTEDSCKTQRQAERGGDGVCRDSLFGCHEAGSRRS
ncbi:hypothetical protein NL108_016435 [Boleophthalmus pectinirostris]|uniref:uncharacterized protein si:dkey-171c9.3 n=1 Tax=Boleophthalmus pectinirostris TaxID=150288 RepID=UPI00242F4573|nr:uncharacterized protein si:dkey-171c9.3 [Boleophthalmus pectinirostris]KAJ0055933.1 hypothetical protein NL108_016435 [Boleophthalmus pectinirostris]